MIVKDELLSKLRRFFGLNLYEVKIWASLLSRGVSTAGELSDMGNVPRSRSYDVLESLEKKGFVVMKIGKPIKYIAVHPAEVVERVKKNLHEEAKEKINRLEELKKTEVIEELTNLHSKGIELIESSDLSGSLKGRHNLYNHLELTIRGAEKSVKIMTTGDGFIRKTEWLTPVLEELKKRGVNVKIAFTPTKDSKAHSVKIKGLADLRESNAIKGRFVVVDDKEIIFMALDDKDVHPIYDLGIWVNTPFFAKAVSDMYEMAWKQMKPVTAK